MHSKANLITCANTVPVCGTRKVLANITWFWGFFFQMNGDPLVCARTSTTKPTVFPILLNEEMLSSNPDSINPPFSIMSKWPVKESKDAFRPSKTFRHVHFQGNKQSSVKNVTSRNQKEVVEKNYSCPSIVDMNNTIFYHHDLKRERPRRIIDGFFPNKIRSTSGSNVNRAMTQQGPRTPAQVNGT